MGREEAQQWYQPSIEYGEAWFACTYSARGLSLEAHTTAGVHGPATGQRLDLIVLKLVIIMFSNIYVNRVYKLKTSYAEQLVLFESEFEF